MNNEYKNTGVDTSRMDTSASNLPKPEKQPIGLEAMCWSCNKVWNISLLPIGAKDVKCDCGGYVVTPSGKVMSRPIHDKFDSRAPLLEADNKKKIILLGDE